MKERAEGRIFISYAVVREILRRRFFHIPKPINQVVLKEMQEHKLIKRIGNTRDIKYELTGGDIDKLLNQYISFI